MRNPRLRDTDGTEYDPETGRPPEKGPRIVPMMPFRRWVPMSKWERRVADMEEDDA